MFKFRLPLRCILFGNSGSGKSHMLSEIISRRDELIDGKIDKIIYCAKYDTSMPLQLRNDPILQFHENLPSEEIIRNESGKNVLIVLEDLLESAFASTIVSELFTAGRHRGLNVILSSQSLFPNYRNARSISLNANYIIIFRNLRDLSQTNTLARQVCPSNSKQFYQMYLNNVNKPFSYLLLDFTPETPDILRYRSDILNKYKNDIFVTDDNLRKYAEYEEAQPVSSFEAT